MSTDGAVRQFRGREFQRIPVMVIVRVAEFFYSIIYLDFLLSKYQNWVMSAHTDREYCTDCCFCLTAKSCEWTSTCRWKPKFVRSRKKHTKPSRKTESSSFRYVLLGARVELWNIVASSVFLFIAYIWWFSCCVCTNVNQLEAALWWVTTGFAGSYWKEGILATKRIEIMLKDFA